MEPGAREFVDLTRSLQVLLGIPPEERSRRREQVHLTIARDAAPDLVERLREIVVPPLPAWVVDRIWLYRSHLGSGPPRYEELERAVLAGGDGDG